MHSLHSSGAMVMHIAGVPDRTLMDIGRWCSLGFVVYIKQQISSFSAGVSAKNERATLVSAPLSNQPPNDLTHNPFHISPIPDLSNELSNTLVWTTQPHLQQLYQEIQFHVF